LFFTEEREGLERERKAIQRLEAELREREQKVTEREQKMIKTGGIIIALLMTIDEFTSNSMYDSDGQREEAMGGLAGVVGSMVGIYRYSTVKRVTANFNPGLCSYIIVISVIVKDVKNQRRSLEEEGSGQYIKRDLERSMW